MEWVLQERMRIEFPAGKAHTDRKVVCVSTHLAIRAFAAATVRSRFTTGLRLDNLRLRVLRLGGWAKEFLPKRLFPRSVRTT